MASAPKKSFPLGTPPGLSESISSSERRLKLVVEYDGTPFSGWQRQLNGPSVQEHLEDAVKSLVGKTTTVVGASRTDAGVHARGQVASFVTTADISVDGFRRGININVPREISVASVVEVPMSFHPRFDSHEKWYRYSIFCRSSPCPMHRLYSWHRPKPLDIEPMQRAATFLLGEHDFSAFRARHCSAEHAQRNIRKIDVTQAGELIYVDVYGNAFLRNMVRIIAGTLVDVAEGRLTPESVGDILASGDRTQGGQTAPAHGLTLMEVRY
jgi:tRNA pseudouridine38-40 synthase